SLFANSQPLRPASWTFSLSNEHVGSQTEAAPRGARRSLQMGALARRSGPRPLQRCVLSGVLQKADRSRSCILYGQLTQLLPQMSGGRLWWYGRPVLLLLVLVPSAAFAHSEKRIALLIGNRSMHEHSRMSIWSKRDTARWPRRPAQRTFICE